MDRNVTPEINSGQALNWLQNQLSRMAKRDFMPLPGVSGSRCFELLHFVKDRLTQKFLDPETSSR